MPDTGEINAGGGGRGERFAEKKVKINFARNKYDTDRTENRAGL